MIHLGLVTLAFVLALDSPRPAAANGGTRRAAEAPLEPEPGAEPGHYDGLLRIPEPGPWRVTVAITGPAGAGEAAFEVEVQEPAGVDWRVLAAALPLVIPAVWWSLRHQRGDAVEPAAHRDAPRSRS
ncbi:MAG: hypothetical protein HY002_12775 [Candidatus Rokubacteria bacterium]|nr:hypothetical protein [Candidatus Rokubacteria bacterium]